MIHRQTIIRHRIAVTRIVALVAAEPGRDDEGDASIELASMEGLRCYYGIAPMWVAQLTDFEQLAMTTWRPFGTLPFLMTPFYEARNQLYHSMLRRIAGYGCFAAGFKGPRRARGVRGCLSFKGEEGAPLARCSRPPDTCPTIEPLGQHTLTTAATICKVCWVRYEQRILLDGVSGS